MTTLNKPANEKTQAAANTNYNEILGLGFKIEIRSQSNGKSRAYLTDNKNERIMENGVPISIDFYDNKGQSVNPVRSREGSHLDYGLKLLLEKAKKAKLTETPEPKSKKVKFKM